jgi:chemotaxis protein CheD
MFYDQKLQIKGMNHFLLPITNSSNEDMKYGLYSVEMMLNEMYKMGCKKQNMIAKIAGGADVAGIGGATSSIRKSIGQRNVEFALDFCSIEGFKIISNHTRGTVGRVILLTNNFETFIKKIDNYTQTCEMFKQENTLQKEVYTNQKIKNKIELF